MVTGLPVLFLTYPLVIPAQARLQDVVERRLEQAAKESSGCVYRPVVIPAKAGIQ